MNDHASGKAIRNEATTSVEMINNLIATKNHVEKMQISDGYHTFEKLYGYRAVLFIALVKQFKHKAWRYTSNHDGATFDGYFGLSVYIGKAQISFHLDNKYLHLVQDLPHFEKNPNYDGHTPNDVYNRLLMIEENSADAALILANQKLSANNTRLNIETSKLMNTITELEERIAQLEKINEYLRTEKSNIKKVG